MYFYIYYLRHQKICDILQRNPPHPYMLVERTSKILCFSPLGHSSVYSLVSYIGINQSMKQLQQLCLFSILLCVTAFQVTKKKEAVNEE